MQLQQPQMLRIAKPSTAVQIMECQDQGKKTANDRFSGTQVTRANPEVKKKLTSGGGTEKMGLAGGAEWGF